MAANTAVNLQVHALPNVVVDPASPFLCQNSSMTLTASGASTYVWSPATGLDRADIAAPVASPMVSTVYQILGTDDAGCQNTASVKVAVVSKENVTVMPDSISVCDKETVQLVAKGADIYYWLEDVTGSDAPGVVTARPTASGIYTVIGRDIHECFTDTALIRVTVLPVPTVDGGPDVEVLAGNPVLLAATGSADVTEWKWTPADYLSCTDCSQPISSPKKPEEYIVMVKNAVGCMAKDTVEAKILCVELNVRIPDAFSPNGDGKNDRFVVLGIGEVKHLVIYDRWGSKVWERSNFYPADASSCWDGTVHGQPGPVGAYVYYVEMECPTGGVFGRRGTVVLVR
jgi:gliding motility-associated-like protein